MSKATSVSDCGGGAGGSGGSDGGSGGAEGGDGASWHEQIRRRPAMGTLSALGTLIVSVRVPPYTMQPPCCAFVHAGIGCPAPYTSDPTAEHAAATRCHSASSNTSPTCGAGAPDAGMQVSVHEIAVSPGTSTCRSSPAHVSVHVAPCIAK